MFIDTRNAVINSIMCSYIDRLNRLFQASERISDTLGCHATTMEIVDDVREDEDLPALTGKERKEAEKLVDTLADMDNEQDRLCSLYQNIFGHWPQNSGAGYR
jgi:hypothetical protein